MLKNFRVFFNNSMNFSTHCDYESKKLSKRIGLLFKIRHLIPKPFLLTPFNAILFPVYNYASNLWGLLIKYAPILSLNCRKEP
jgi:hypothetical protein